MKLTWYEAHTGETFRITTHGTGSDGVVRVETYGEVLQDYRVHEESKSFGPDGEVCSKATRGILSQRKVSMLGPPGHLGKESNKLEERMREEVGDERDYLNVYELRTCACGCGEQVSRRSRYVDAAHKQKAYRARRITNVARASEATCVPQG